MYLRKSEPGETEQLTKISTDAFNTDYLVGGAVLFDYGKTVYIGRIFISPEHHRKGYGYSQL